MKSKDTKLIIFLIIVIIGGVFVIKTLTGNKNSNNTNKETTTKEVVTTNTTTETTTTTTKPVTTTKKATTTIKKTEEAKETTTKTPATKAPDYNGTTSKGYQIVTKDGITYIDGYLVANKTYSLPSDYNPGLSSKTKSAASEMFKAFKTEKGKNMEIGSGFRTYSTQEWLYNKYVKRDGKAGADRYSARPGHSEHQTGLAIDICVDGYECINSGFNGTMPANWLSDNAYKYGFILRYPKGKESETGYKYESWHFRYVGKELAQTLYNDGSWITMEDYFGIDSKYKD